uniref:Pr1-like protein n=1 Tax=Oryza sativa subsp. japonica TaxID=39947 RepID=Q6YSD9_ORYSJ|nr:pr1-like protein [Oryza sativa Japonica Group]BAD32008.1 pr1-like protein [Oryza sativa Japonica Group]
MNRVPTSWGFYFPRVNKPRERARGPGPREWGPRVSPSVHGGPGARGWRRPALWVPRVSRTRGRGRLTAGPTWQPRGRAEGGLAGTADGSGAPAPRWSPPATNGAAERHPRERREGGSEGDGLRLTPVDGDDGNGGRSGRRRRRDADGVDGNAAKPMEMTPSRKDVRSDVGGEPKVDGDGGERGARREHESDGESERRAAETEERSTGIEYIATGGGERGRGERKPRAEISGAIEDAGELRGMNPDESEGEREGKEGESGEGNAGSNSPLFNARGDGGMRRNPRRRRR